RCPSRIGTVIESDGDLMLASSPLMIKRREFRKLDVFGSEIAVCVHGELSGPIHAILINRHNFAIADVSYCVAGWYNFERLSRWIVEFEISRNAQRIPNCRVFTAQPIQSEAAGLLVPHLEHLVATR